MSEPLPVRGALFVAQLKPEGYPIFELVRRDLRDRDEAMANALRLMRQGFQHCVIFIREDGCHEAWGRAELENWLRAKS